MASSHEGVAWVAGEGAARGQCIHLPRCGFTACPTHNLAGCNRLTACRALQRLQDWASIYFGYIDAARKLEVAHDQVTAFPPFGSCTSTCPLPTSVDQPVSSCADGSSTEARRHQSSFGGLPGSHACRVALDGALSCVYACPCKAEDWQYVCMCFGLQVKLNHDDDCVPLGSMLLDLKLLPGALEVPLYKFLFEERGQVLPVPQCLQCIESYT